MRCRVYNCIYNDDGYCEQPDYVCIESDGSCDQMFVKSEESTDE